MVTLLRSTVTCAAAPAALGDTPIPAVLLLLNSLSRTSTDTAAAAGTIRSPSTFERDTLPEIRTELPPSMRMPACAMFEITLDSTCTSPACTRMPLPPP